MSKTLDFNKIKKEYLTVRLADEKNTVLMISTPTKGLLNSLVSIKDRLASDDMGDEAIDDLYDICARIMSRNKTGVVITSAAVQELFDFEDVIIFIRAYTEFINEVSSAKN